MENVPNWKNYNGRIGGAYDLFGDGSTAIKASAGRYVSNEGMGVAQGFNPISTGSDRRDWTDLNGDLTALNPDGTPQFDEIGPSFNPNFGTRTITTTLDPDLGAAPTGNTAPASSASWVPAGRSAGCGTTELTATTGGPTT